MIPLTIGMPTYDDFDGCYFTIQALRAYSAPALANCEILVIDNHPHGQHSDALKHFLGWVKGDVTARLVPFTDAVGTAAAKDRVFREASGEIVLCLDSHVLLLPGALAALRAYFDLNPETGDLISGPMMYDDLRSCATHFDDVWRGEMWGIWARDSRVDDPSGEPFEIPAMGMGAFACRRNAWLGFNPRFRGFGGEEFYIHTKFRQAGHRCLCLPAFRWVHRFGRPAGVPYPVRLWDKLRNYVIGLQELGIPLDRMRAHFVDELHRVTPAEWDALVANPDYGSSPSPGHATPRVAKPCSGCPGSQTIAPHMTLEDLYRLAVGTPSDIQEHVPKLRELAAQCQHVTDCGSRPSASTVALLAGQPRRLVSYAIRHDPMFDALQARRGNTDFVWRIGNPSTITIEPTDLLFMDYAPHSADIWLAQLRRHAAAVRRWIVLHDTVTWGEHAEDGGPGVLPALRRFVTDHPEWSVVYHSPANHGLTVLSCDARDKPPLPGVVTLAANFARALAAHVADGAKKTSPGALQARLERCTLCTHRIDDRCSVCGCYIARKAEWAEQECPLGHWAHLTDRPPTATVMWESSQ